MDPNPGTPLAALRSRLTAVLLCLLAFPACEAPPAEPPSGATDCLPAGELVVELYGATRASIDWRGDVLSCEGMTRPEGEGARLRFSGTVGADNEQVTVAFILGLPGLEEGQTALELPTNVTMMEEGSGRFFATQDTETCWTDIIDHERIGDRDYRISGVLYCVAPLAELNGSSNISFAELKFTGQLDWEPPE